MHNNGNGKKTIAADISLFFVAIFWGLNFVVIKESLEIITPFAYLGIRFTLAGIILIPLFWKRLVKANRSDYLAGCLIGLFLFGGFAFQTIGLLYTTPANSGFITGSAVIIVPFLYFIITRRSPGWPAFVGGGLAAIGLYLLSSGDTLGISFGDALTLVGAFMFAAHIISISFSVVKRDPLVLAFTQILFTGLVSLALAFILEPTEGMFIQPPLIWGAILYAIIFCTIGAFVTQTLAQRFTPPVHAVLILSLEAVFAGVFSYFFWDEIFTMKKLSGAFFIFAGILLAELHPYVRARFMARQASIVRRGLPPVK